MQAKAMNCKRYDNPPGITFKAMSSRRMPMAMKYVGSSTKTIACDGNMSETTRNSPDVAPDVSSRKMRVLGQSTTHVVEIRRPTTHVVEEIK